MTCDKQKNETNEPFYQLPVQSSLLQSSKAFSIIAHCCVNSLQWNNFSIVCPLLLIQGVIPQTGHQNVWNLAMSKKRSLWAHKSSENSLDHCEEKSRKGHRSCVALWAEAKGGDAAIQHFINGFLHQSNDCSELKILSKIGNPMRQLIPCTEQSGVWFLLSHSVWTCSNIWNLGIQSGFWVCWREWQQPHWPQPVNTQRSSDFPVWLMHSPSSSKTPSNGEFKAQQQTWNT